MIYIFDGKGKGKTTAALGMALRSLGWGKKVVVVQFMKGRKTGESQFKHKGFVLKQFGTKQFVRKVSAKDKELGKKGIEYASKVKCDLLILDEVNTAIKYGIVKVADVYPILEKKKDMVLTGRGYSFRLRRKADVVVEMDIVKKPWKYKARKGLEF
ncbi:cob(I)yrinic acid a,c-diamide adenosyltransferase [archaeon]|nr:cob(I)yrinic acid a,c-diamide adenosyltransferase [archaeon]|tara:strand:+ start:2426 stop:2893 length:468 start_codon:yes stop_codon:yes gene_type:complete